MVHVICYKFHNKTLKKIRNMVKFQMMVVQNVHKLKNSLHVIVQMI